jgi:polar amino acid transport system substrate-binding protein
LFYALLPIAEAATRVITVDEPPSAYLDDDGGVSGYVVDIVRAMHSYMGKPLEIEVLPEARALKTALVNDDVAIFSFTKTAERDKHLQWIGPVMHKSWYVIVRSDSYFDSNQLEDFGSIGVVRGDIRARWVEQQGLSNYKLAASHQQNLRFLEKGRVDAIVYNLSGTHILSKELGIAEGSFKNVSFIKTSPVYIGLSKNFEDYAQWQQAFEAIRDNGELATINAYWLDKLIGEGILSHQREHVLSID